MRLAAKTARDIYQGLVDGWEWTKPAHVYLLSAIGFAGWLYLIVRR